MKYIDARIGQHVHYKGCSTIGECDGVIKKLYAPDIEDPFDHGFALIVVEELPDLWPYSGNDFAPSVNDIEIIN